MNPDYSEIVQCVTQAAARFDASDKTAKDIEDFRIQLQGAARQLGVIAAQEASHEA